LLSFCYRKSLRNLDENFFFCWFLNRKKKLLKADFSESTGVENRAKKARNKKSGKTNFTMVLQSKDLKSRNKKTEEKFFAFYVQKKAKAKLCNVVLVA
jgi:hypothetical protein